MICMRVCVQVGEGVCEDNKPSKSLGVGGLFSNRAFGVFPVSVNHEQSPVEEDMIDQTLSRWT